MTSFTLLFPSCIKKVPSNWKIDIFAIQDAVVFKPNSAPGIPL